MQLSGGPFSFNRFDEYERKLRALEEKDNRSAKQRQADENEYDAYEADPITGGGMDMSMDEWRKQKAKKAAKPSKSSAASRMAKAYEKMKKNESVELGEGKKADKDYDGDGKVESGKEEYFGSRDKAIKKAMKKGKGRSGYVSSEEDEKEEDSQVGDGGFSGDGGGAMGEEYIGEGLTGKRQKRARDLKGTPYQKRGGKRTSRDNVTLHNLADRNDGPGTPGYEKKSTGGKGSRYAGYGDQGAGNKARRRRGEEPMRGNRDPRNEEFESFWIEDENGNIYEGKKDACYHKVKSRYDVWPSAYASGALVKCRKAGAKNWGNSDKKEEFEYMNENRRAARSAGGYKDDSKKQTDPSKEGFTGISGSIKDIMKQNKEIEKRNKKESVVFTDDLIGHEYILEMTASPKENMARRAINKMDNDKKANAEAKIVSEQDQRMASYARALGIMGSHYSGQTIDEGIFDALPKSITVRPPGGPEGDQRMYKDGGGDAAMRQKGQTRDQVIKQGQKNYVKTQGDAARARLRNESEDVQITKEMVIEYLVDEGYANNEVSAEILHQHVSDEFLLDIEEMMMESAD